MDLGHILQDLLGFFFIFTRDLALPSLPRQTRVCGRMAGARTCFPCRRNPQMERKMSAPPWLRLGCIVWKGAARVLGKSARA